ncbi:MAG: glycosyltransferase [Bacteroidetes bacterium]|nr:glycosyltransferase [Bacteroidota bacterium]MCL2302197.1 glycosyltransferase [Lentimicrobiaceae bacterium]MCL2302277.1 glycosyltransferase [Lentimicrobiaceae bacterium]
MNIDFISLYLPEILIVVFGIVVLCQILYYVVIFSRFSFRKQKTIVSQNVPVSIVLTAKNDAHLLIKTLPELLTQVYPQFEVVVVNDNSNDETPQLVTDFQNRFPNLKLVHLESSVTNIKGKKFPLSLGIKAATYEHVLLTDVDCLPASNQWIKLMARHFNDTTKIVLGYSNIRKKLGFFNALIRFDKLHQAIQYFSYCLAKNPFMGVGQNLAYTKTIFFNNKGFASQNHLQFGDDDLFINQVANARNCAIEYEKEAHTISRSGSNFHNWFLLRTFRRKTRKLYPKPDRFLLNFYHFLMTFSYIALGFVIYVTLNNLLYLLIALSILIIKYITQYVCFGFAATKLNEKRLIPYILVFDIVFSVLNPVVYVVSKFKK